ncbi:MAG: hypothetical protein WBB28_20715 [Crinalium sp.]
MGSGTVFLTKNQILSDITKGYHIEKIKDDPLYPNKSFFLDLSDWFCIFDKALHLEHFVEPDAEQLAFFDKGRFQLEGEFCICDKADSLRHIKNIKQKRVRDLPFNPRIRLAPVGFFPSLFLSQFKAY